MTGFTKERVYSQDFDFIFKGKSKAMKEVKSASKGEKEADVLQGETKVGLEARRSRNSSGAMELPMSKSTYTWPRVRLTKEEFQKKVQCGGRQREGWNNGQDARGANSLIQKALVTSCFNTIHLLEVSVF